MEVILLKKQEMTKSISTLKWSYSVCVLVARGMGDRRRGDMKTQRALSECWTFSPNALK